MDNLPTYKELKALNKSCYYVYYFPYFEPFGCYYRFCYNKDGLGYISLDIVNNRSSIEGSSITYQRKSKGETIVYSIGELYKLNKPNYNSLMRLLRKHTNYIAQNIFDFSRAYSNLIEREKYGD